MATEITAKGLLIKIRSMLEERGVCGQILPDILANGVENSGSSLEGARAGIGWNALALDWKLSAVDMDFSYDEMIEAPSLPQSSVLAIERAIAAGGNREEAMALVLAHNCIGSIAASQGQFSVIGQTRSFHDRLEGRCLARLENVHPIRVSLLVEGQNSYHVVHGSTTTVALPCPDEQGNPTTTEVRHLLMEQMPASPRLQDSVRFCMHRNLSLIIASVLSASGCASLGNPRLTELRLEPVRTPNPADIRIWCAAYDKLIATKHALGL